MSLSTASNRVVATGNGVTTVFYFNRLLYDADHLQVYLGAVLQSTGYTVSGVPGAATYVTFTSAPANGVQVLLLRVVPLTQLSVYAVGGAFPAATTEKNFDLAFMALQQFDEINDRAVTLPVTSTLTATNIPDPALTANYNRGIKIKGDGTGLDTFVISGTANGIVTTKGDLHIYGAGAEDRMPVGADGSFLIGASGQARGLKYFTPGTNGYVLQSDSAQTDKLVWVAPNQPRNPIINGNMEIWQRGTSFVSPSVQYTADRWAWRQAGTGAVTVARSTNVPSVASAGILFNYSLEVDVTTADASIGVTDLYQIDTRIEGYNWRHFAQRGITISFWVSSSKTGTHCLFLGNQGQNRSYVAEYTINSADTWEYKTVTIAASPSAGTWDYTNAIGVDIGFVLAVGASGQITAGSWQVTASQAYGSSNQVNVMDSTANFFRLTGVKLELGSIATPIQFVPFEKELTRCRRYYQKSFDYGTAPAQNAGLVGAVRFQSTTGATGSLLYEVPVTPPLRITNAVGTLYNPQAANAQVRNITDGADDTGSTITLYESSGFIGATGAAGNTAGDVHVFHWTADAEL